MVKIRKVRTKVWGKRQSCASNPLARRHRNAAKRGFDRQSTFVAAAGRPLTVETLAQHDAAKQADEQDEAMCSLEDGATERTTKSFATVSISGLTDCSNPTFAGVLKRFWQSPGANHKDICAVLAAVTEVIRKNGGKETETEYFGALMTALETTDDENSLAAIAFLLALVVKRIPKSVLQVKFSPICQVILNILARKVDSQSTALVKSLISCLSEALKAQESAIWSESSTLKSFQALLSFTIHTKPKVRKCSQECVSALLKEAPEDCNFHPSCQTTTKFCIQELEKYKGPNQAVSTLHVLGLLKTIMVVLPTQQVKMLCETMLKLMTLGNVMLSINCLQVLYNMFLDNPKPSTVSPELNGQLINALFDYQPNKEDEQQTVAWLTLMEKAYCHFQTLDNKLCVESCSKLFASCMTYFLSHHSTVKKLAATTMKSLLDNCLLPFAEKLTDEIKVQDSTNSPVLNILKFLETGLKYRYHRAWREILGVVTKYFEVFGKLCPEKLKKCLLSICNLHNSHDIKCRREIQTAVGTAFRTMQPQFVLEVVPLDLDREDNVRKFPRSWLLPVMKDHVCETKMMYFFDELLPLANKLSAKAEGLEKDDSQLEAKVFQTLSSQIWDLLPAFCNKPTDLSQNFKSVAKTLGTMMTERPERLMIICQALRVLISKNLENEENVVVLSKFAKNYLPILFNIYTGFDEKNDAISLPVLETLKCYLQITDSQLVKKFFEKALERVQDGSTTFDKKRMLMDLVIAMVPYLSKELVERLYGIILPWLKEKNVRFQKKSYRILEEICTSSSPPIEAFVQEHMAEIQQTLTESLAEAVSAAKAPRLRCLVQVVKKLTPDQQQFLNSIIPEVILSTKEKSSKARSASLKVLVEIGETLIRCSDQSVEACIESYLTTLTAGFGGSPIMVSGTIIAISRIIYEYKGSVSLQVLKQLITTMTNLLLSNKREIVKSTLGFFKVAISVTNPDDFAPFLSDLAVALVNWNEDSRNKFRFKAQVLFERLIRKFGYQTIHQLVPEKHRKFVHNIHKCTERAKRKKMDNHVNKMKMSSNGGQIDSYEDLMFGSDSEDDGDDNKDNNIKLKKEKLVSKTFIRENESDEPLDLLSSNISQHVTATEPIDKHKLTESEFEVADDGRLVIPEEKEQPKKTDKFPALVDDIDMEFTGKKSGKRKMTESDDEMSETVDKRAKRKAADFGDEYRAKKAGGDIKKKGKPDPYAYMPLNTQSLNKRKRAKLSGQFQGIVKAAKKGAQKSKKGHKRK